MAGLHHRLVRAAADLGAGPPAPHAAGRGGHPGRHGRSVHPDSEGLLPGPGHGPDPGRIGGDRVDFLCRHGAAAAGAGRGRAQGPGCPEPVLLHRRGWQQRHAQQRPLPDQPEAAATSAATASPTSYSGCSRKRPMCPASRCTCSPRRTCRWTPRSAARNTSSCSRAPAPTPSAPGRPSWLQRCVTARNWPTWSATWRTTAWRPTSPSTAIRRPAWA